MKQFLSAVAALFTGAGLLIAAAPANAGHVDVGVNIGVPGIVAPAPVYVEPRPPVVVQPAPVYVEPRPVYVERGPDWRERREHEWRERERERREHEWREHRRHEHHDNGWHRGERD